jgi:hypothetical protein
MRGGKASGFSGINLPPCMVKLVKEVEEPKETKWRLTQANNLLTEAMPRVIAFALFVPPTSLAMSWSPIAWQTPAKANA